jgi:hypothetical protein
MVSDAKHTESVEGKSTSWMKKALENGANGI